MSLNVLDPPKRASRRWAQQRHGKFCPRGVAWRVGQVLHLHSQHREPSDPRRLARQSLTPSLLDTIRLPVVPQAALPTSKHQ